jgi:hypothetical protein
MKIMYVLDMYVEIVNKYHKQIKCKKQLHVGIVFLSELLKCVNETVILFIYDHYIIRLLFT